MSRDPRIQALHDALVEAVAWVDAYPGPKPTRCERCPERRPSNAVWRVTAGHKLFQTTLDAYLCVACAQQVMDARQGRPGFINTAPCSDAAFTPEGRLDWGPA